MSFEAGKQLFIEQGPLKSVSESFGPLLGFGAALKAAETSEGLPEIVPEKVEETFDFIFSIRDQIISEAVAFVAEKTSSVSSIQALEPIKKIDKMIMAPLEKNAEKYSAQSIELAQKAVQMASKNTVSMEVLSSPKAREEILGKVKQVLGSEFVNKAVSLSGKSPSDFVKDALTKEVISKVLPEKGIPVSSVSEMREKVSFDKSLRTVSSSLDNMDKKGFYQDPILGKDPHSVKASLAKNLETAKKVKSKDAVLSKKEAQNQVTAFVKENS